MMVWCDADMPVFSVFRETSIAKWMTLPLGSGNMSQLYRGFYLDLLIAKLAGATIVASVFDQFEPFTSHFASL
jgi:hypothetical protein